jgi:hypothetical protein
LLVKFRWFLGELRRNHQVTKSWSPGRGRGKGGRGRGASGGYLGWARAARAVGSQHLGVSENRENP